MGFPSVCADTHADKGEVFNPLPIVGLKSDLHDTLFKQGGIQTTSAINGSQLFES